MKGDYHMLYFWETQERRLYNIREDIGETNNLAKTEPELLQALSEELTDSLKAYDAQRPTYTETGQLIPWPDEAPLPVEVGDVVPPTAGIFQYSTEDEKHYYRIVDNRATNFTWTLGNHNGYSAIQATTEVYGNAYDATQQYFYFMPGSDNSHFRIYTVDGRNVDYVDGLTGSSWNGGNVGSGTTLPYMQYGTSTSGEFQLVSTGTFGRYAIKAPNGDILNDRGTANGTAANMKWVINTYSGITLDDAGSNYKFVPVQGTSVGGLIEALYQKYQEKADYVGAHDLTTITPLYEEAMKDPQLEDLRTLEEAYAQTPELTLQMGSLYRLRNYMRKILPAIRPATVRAVISSRWIRSTPTISCAARAAIRPSMPIIRMPMPCGAWRLLRTRARSICATSIRDSISRFRRFEQCLCSDHGQCGAGPGIETCSLWRYAVQGSCSSNEALRLHVSGLTGTGSSAA